MSHQAPRDSAARGPRVPRQAPPGPARVAASGEMRVARALSVLGFCSRREADRLIAGGRVSIDGQVVQSPGALVDPSQQQLEVDRKPVNSKAPKLRYVALNKPLGVVSTVRDPHAKETVVGLVGADTRLYPVGRLDKDSEGLTLLTNDGELANWVTHPRYGVEKEYQAFVDIAPSRDAIARLLHGKIYLDTRPCSVAQLVAGRREVDGVWVRIVLREGKNHEVRRLFEAVGSTVKKLIRTRIGPVRLGSLALGAHRELSAGEIEALIPRHRPKPKKKGRGSATPSEIQAPAEPRFVVAIDGPAAAGKSSVGALVAECLGGVVVDTGVFYRALTLTALRNGIAVADGKALAGAAASLNLTFLEASPELGGQSPILLDGVDITDMIRSREIDANVSQVAGHAEVRQALVAAQRRAGEKGTVVVVGRDIGSVIFPDADVKLYLDASAEVRAQRRSGQLGHAEESMAAMEEALRRRDSLDTGRETAPLQVADGAIVVATDDLTIEQVVERILDLVAEARGRG